MDHCHPSSALATVRVPGEDLGVASHSPWAEGPARPKHSGDGSWPSMTWIRRSHTSNEFRRQRARGATRVNDALPSCNVGKISDLCPSEQTGDPSIDPCTARTNLRSRESSSHGRARSLISPMLTNMRRLMILPILMFLASCGSETVRSTDSSNASPSATTAPTAPTATEPPEPTESSRPLVTYPLGGDPVEWCLFNMAVSDFNDDPGSHDRARFEEIKSMIVQMRSLVPEFGVARQRYLDAQLDAGFYDAASDEERSEIFTSNTDLRRDAQDNPTTDDCAAYGVES